MATCPKFRVHLTGRRPSLTEQQREYTREERSRGVGQRELAKRLEVSR